MSLNKLFKKIESHEISVRTNVTSGLRSFVRALESERAVGRLFQLARERGNALQILRRIREVAEFRVDPRYENSLDTALSAYLRALQVAHPALARIGASAVVHAQNCWWASKVAQAALADPTTSSGEASKTVDATSNGAFCANTESSESGESYVVATWPAFFSVGSIHDAEIGASKTTDMAELVTEPRHDAPIQLLHDRTGSVSVNVMTQND